MESVFADRLGTAIVARGTNARQLALESGVSPSNLSRYLKGDVYPEILKSLIRFAEVLHVSTDYLLGLTDIMVPSPATTESIREFDEKFSHLYTDEGYLLYNGVYNALPLGERPYLVEMVRGFGIHMHVLADDGVTLTPNIL